MNIKQKFIPKGTNARSGYAMTPKYITIHNTANTSKGSDAENHARYMTGGGSNTYVSYHYVVDDKEIYQLLPDNEVAWHAGDGAKGTGNRQSLSIEICENSDGDILKATNLAVELTAYLMKKYNISISNVVQHNKWTGKNCPNRIRKGDPYNWATFLNKVQNVYNGTVEESVSPVTPTLNGLSIGDEIKLVAGARYVTNGRVIPAWVINSKLYFRGTTKKGYIMFSTQKTGAITGTVEKKYIITSEFKSYRVKVICKELNIRKTPNWNKSDIVGTIKNGGVYTIIDETMLDGTKFGLLKSSERNGVNYRDRWISLGSVYVRKM